MKSHKFMRSVAAFLLVNAAIAAVHVVGAGVALGAGEVVHALELGGSQLAWVITGILSAGSAIAVAARLAGIGRGASWLRRL